MARDRQRAKQRKARREPSPPKRGEGNGLTPDARPLHRENVPGPVEHTGEVDEFEAALVAGADGEPEPDPDAADRASLAGEAPDAVADPDLDADGAGDGRDAGGDAADGRGDVVTSAREPSAAAPGAVSAGRLASASPAEAAQGRGGSRFLNFLRASWAELQRVQWPDRRAVGQATMVVLGFVIIAGAFLGLADFVAEQLVDLII